jgi:hypothetical protein
MDSTVNSTRVDPRFDGDGAPTVATNGLTGIEEALTRLAHRAASDPPNAQPGAPVSGRSADARTARSFAAATLGPADLSAQIPRAQPSPRERRNLARVAIAVCLGVSAIWAWRSYGSAATDMIATRALPVSARPSPAQMPTPQMPDPAPGQTAARPVVEPPAQAASTASPATTAASAPAAVAAKRQPIDTIARDIAVLRETVERLAAGQEQLNHEIARLQADRRRPQTPEKRAPRRLAVPAHDAFEPTQNPNAPGVPRTLGSIVVRQ